MTLAAAAAIGTLRSRQKKMSQVTQCYLGLMPYRVVLLQELIPNTSFQVQFMQVLLQNVLETVTENISFSLYLSKSRNVVERKGQLQ